ncbi:MULTISPECIES: acetolactate synthase AlsS [unclassified Vibrio]|uniref:acetolactate synthase AlsS n=2 Tax=Vibrio TaxID=662 RepID=UPI0012680BEB|nr:MULTISPECIES: acetolactate synthase AlsS [unclassified Vibrio]QFT39909.1 Acetolactate synthase, catabolic [Vibrio sp. THAF64]QGM37584.1 Acetolactate synthase, catabolic [Vibrio sp. THAF191d]QGN73309.1 Acetolactate synthase, catabolic [Vibrio sp. THAF191c]
MMNTPLEARTGAQLMAQQLEATGVQYVFGLPGAKIDRLFDALNDTSITVIPVRHEANAAFMAGCVGRLTGRAGVALVTSGPGCGNLVTGVATANAEGDAMIAIGGAVKRCDQHKQTHQSMASVSIFRSITQFSAEISHVDATNEVLANAFRIAESGRQGACFVSVPQDVLDARTTRTPIVPTPLRPQATLDRDRACAVAERIAQAERAVVLVGLNASVPRVSHALTSFLQRTQLPVVGTYQAAGAVSTHYYHRFAGRVGLFNNQPGDVLLREADMIVAIGFNPIEYDPELWMPAHHELIHIDIDPADYQNHYRPCLEIVGDLAHSLEQISQQVSAVTPLSQRVGQVLDIVAAQRQRIQTYPVTWGAGGFHPLTLVKALQRLITPDTTLCLDMGSFHIWIARYLNCCRARQMLVSNGQQTMGVALPWAITASLLNPHEKVVSVSGDGGFLQSSMELETAVRLKSNLLHLVWVDNAYNMVEMQALKKYQRSSCVKFGPLDIQAYAEAFGATAFTVTCAEALMPTLQRAMATSGPVVVALPVDYSHNPELMAPYTALMERGAEQGAPVL